MFFGSKTTFSCFDHMGGGRALCPILTIFLNFLSFVKRNGYAKNQKPKSKASIFGRLIYGLVPLCDVGIVSTTVACRLNCGNGGGF